MRGRSNILDTINGPLKAELANSDFYQLSFKPLVDECLRKLGERKIERIICYGLGSFHCAIEKSSRTQLAVLILLYEYLIEQGSPIEPVIEIYDPNFEEKDRETLSRFIRPKFKLIPNNESCSRKIQSTNLNRCTLFYMIHLDKIFYNNLLGANWGANELKMLVVLGNSFNEMIENEVAIKARRKLNYLNLLVSGDTLVELILDSTYDKHHTFSGTSIHFIN